MSSVARSRACSTRVGWRVALFFCAVLPWVPQRGALAADPERDPARQQAARERLAAGGYLLVVEDFIDRCGSEDGLPEAIVRTYLEAGFAGTAVHVRTKRTALTGAARAGNTKVVAALLAAGVRAEHVDGEGESPLALAVVAGDARSVSALLSAGAKIDTRSGKRWRTPLHYAAEKGTPALLKALLAAGAKVETGDKDGMSALHFAVRAASLAKVQQLLAAKAPLELRNRWGQTPLIGAVTATRPKVSIVKVLVAAGADFRVRWAADQRDLLHLARSSRSAALVAYLKGLGLGGQGGGWYRDVKWERIYPWGALPALLLVVFLLLRSVWIRRALICGVERGDSDHRPLSRNAASLVLLACGPLAAGGLWALGGVAQLAMPFDLLLAFAWMVGWGVVLWGASRGCPKCGGLWKAQRLASHLERSPSEEEAIPGTFQRRYFHQVDGWEALRCTRCAHEWRISIKGEVSGRTR